MKIEQYEEAKRLRNDIQTYKDEIEFWERCKGYDENYGDIKTDDGCIKARDSAGFTVVLSAFLPFSELRNMALSHYRSMLDNAEFQFKQL